MLEQEYFSHQDAAMLARWTHIACRFNFEVRGWWPVSFVAEARAKAGVHESEGAEEGHSLAVLDPYSPLKGLA